MKPFNVIAITAKSERLIFCAKDRFSACCMAMSKNIYTLGTIYLVETPRGSRMTIKKQRQYLSFAQSYKGASNEKLR